MPRPRKPQPDWMSQRRICEVCGLHICMYFDPCPICGSHQVHFPNEGNRRCDSIRRLPAETARLEALPPKPCISCGLQVRATWLFCPFCGAQQRDGRLAPPERLVVAPPNLARVMEETAVEATLIEKRPETPMPLKLCLRCLRRIPPDSDSCLECP